MTEHFVTLFDKNFLVFGLALHKSLQDHAGDFCLWVLCMDRTAEERLLSLNLPKLRVIPLAAAENDELLRIKPGRNAGEYCWTMTPFSITAVFSQDPSVNRVTYVDADVFFFNDPRILIQEMIEAGKHVLITDHAYEPCYDQTATSGRFCVQFMTFNRSEEGLKVCKWWQDRCVEWCFNRVENGKFGDQKYLDSWPTIFPKEVHILEAVHETLAPWNVKMLLKPGHRPVMYHFHGLRFMNRRLVRLFDGYQTGCEAKTLYSKYLSELKTILSHKDVNYFDLIIESAPNGLRQHAGRLWRKLKGARAEKSIFDTENGL
jgi:hypothetical protein